MQLILQMINLYLPLNFTESHLSRRICVNCYRLAWLPFRCWHLLNPSFIWSQIPCEIAASDLSSHYGQLAEIFLPLRHRFCAFLRPNHGLSLPRGISKSAFYHAQLLLQISPLFSPALTVSELIKWSIIFQVTSYFSAPVEPLACCCCPLGPIC